MCQTYLVNYLVTGELPVLRPIYIKVKTYFTSIAQHFTPITQPTKIFRYKT